MDEQTRTALHAKYVIPAAYRLLGDRRLRLVAALMERDSWTREQARAHQAGRLEWLFDIAARHNPYWSAEFQKHGLNPRGSDPFAELAKLPVLTKDEVRANWRQMRSMHLPDFATILDTSSGSTGMPITVHHSRTYRELHAAMMYRVRAWMGLRTGEPILTVRADSGHMTLKKKLLRAMRKRVERETLIDAFRLNPATLKRRLARISADGPAAIFGYVTAVATIARLSRQHDISWPSVRAVATSSEPLREADRALLCETFGARVFDRYGSREVLSISMECDHGSHHIFADCNVVEFEPVPGSTGLHHVVVTPLDNDAMPMFRYRNGDTASAVAGACACGRTSPLMTACEGRVCNNFVTRDGRLVHGVYFAFFFNYCELFRSFQFRQTSHENIDLLVVPEGRYGPDHEAFLERCRRRIREDYNGAFQVHTRIVDEIPRTQTGKHLYTISDVLRNV
ncbi:MAG: phenylacetate--CoA ligase family protein [Phycisphaerales bacterium]|nr:phenylacetate--CoA ligase family protein [Phycisphaerales bacterium]